MPKTRPRVERLTAEKYFSRNQKLLYGTLLLAAILGLTLWTYWTLIIFISAATVFWLFFVGLKLALHVASLKHSTPDYPPVSADDPDLPTYTIYAPMYDEANMLQKFVDWLDGLQYPKDKLQVILLIEDRDTAMRAELVAMELPVYYEIILVPDLGPRGKPKPLNLGLEQAKGPFCVIYDAEDRPEHDQLLKAVAQFRAAPDDVACLQARLYFWNTDTSWITRFYNLEYIVHYEFVLPGLVKLGLIPPLGGTSNHFRTRALHDVAISRDKLPAGAEGIGGWDPWNVTEDAELAGALTAAGYRVEMLNSATREEATARLPVADRQRRRWLRGYLQTGLVYTRQPLQNIRAMGFKKWFIYNLLMLGTPLSLWLSPVFWALTITYFVTRSPFIESLFPPPLFYSGVLLFVGGNLLLFYQLLGAAMHRGSYTSVKYTLLAPLWWAFTSYTSYRMLFDKGWNKTPHGHDLHKEAKALKPAPQVSQA